jgi:DnaJ-class molecular chaperone
MKKCPDCDADAIFDSSIGNGECSGCHGTGGELDPLEEFVEALSSQPQTCKKCSGSGKCQTCGGDGYL